MMGKQHLPMAFGASLLLAELGGVTGTSQAVFVLAGTLAGVLPDVDHGGTYANRALLGGFDLIPGHREGWSHSPVASLGFGALTAAMTWWLLGASTALLLASAVFWGCIVHLLGDTPTHRGIKWLWPFSARVFSLHWFATGGQASLRDRVLEIVVAWGFTLAALGLALWLD
jgi:membrane-bound metal-dependent hydrolase YbcI (DUF457 family)